ncbi:hypothetical protein QYM36_010566 [Artemia franciscana]|uniref:Uncharacterized protein n=1 Tax=Artemia franciscana TaxID=6661 RepID=A0AA88HXU7_ARTSF|nr:hypothetical protein QYM36_010566 [Artemia franciscana]
MKEVFEKSAVNTQYGGPRIQNELVDICGQLSAAKIVNQVKSAHARDKWKKFFQLFLEVTCICQGLEITIAILQNRNVVKIPHDIPAEKRIEFYFQVLLLIPLVDQLIQSLESRFTKHNVILKGLSRILPSIVVKDPNGDVKELIKLCASDLTGSEYAIKTKLQIWWTKWLKVALVPEVA